MLEWKQEPSPADRRYSARWTTDKELSWRPYRGRKPRSSKLVERSLTSMAFFSSNEDAPPLGSMLCPSDATMGDRHGFRVAIVRRKHPVPEGDLVIVEILA